ncbi:MAG TPA: hypothetical protein VFI04_07080 [Gaiellaceae bacterium]|jgi:hypothetical protein|nr:hypothetical protein [Gaiellaceae bacterium]
MRRHLLDVAVLFTLSSGACLYVSLAVPGDRSLAIHVYLLFLGALVMLVVISAVGAAVPRPRRSELTRALDQRPAPPPAVPQLARVEREVTLALGSAYDLHARLLPDLREIAAARLERTGRRPGPDTLGRWWELLRPDRPEPRERFAPGIREADLRALISDLERL